MYSNRAIGLTYLSEQETVLTGTRSHAFYEGGEILGSFMCVGEKDIGLNPGFFAVRINEAYHKQVRNLIIEKLQDNNRFFLERLAVYQIDKLAAIGELLKPGYTNTPLYQTLLHDPICQNSLIPEILSDYNQNRLKLRCYITKKLVETNPLFEAVLEDRYFSKTFAINELTNPLPHTSASYRVLSNHPRCRERIIEAFKAELQSETHIEKYIFKYDYQLTHFGLALIPLSNFLLESNYKRFYHRLKIWVGNQLALRMTIWRARLGQLKHLMTHRKANQLAMLSCLATDLARARGLNVPNQRLAKAQYPNGKLKLLVFSDWSDDFKSVTSSQLIVKPKGPNYFYSDNDLSLGQTYLIHLTLMTLLGHRSHFGVEGSTFYGFDLGGKPISFQTILKHLERTFDCAPFRASLYVYCDTTLVDKMQSLYLIHKVRTGQIPAASILSTLSPTFIETLTHIQKDGDIQIIDAYLKQFPEHQSLLQQLRSDLLALDEGILKKFENRITLTPQLLTLIENLEKLCSPVTTTSQNGHVILNHLQIHPKHHTIWDIEFSADHIIFKTSKNVEKILHAFFSPDKLLALEIKIDDHTLTITHADQLKLADILNETSVAAYHNLQTAPMLEENRMIIKEEDYDRLSISKDYFEE